MMTDMRGIAGVWIELHGRKVFKHKIDNAGYIPCEHPAAEKFPDDANWYLMIETDGRTWIWDGWIAEG
tara:strand:+ start:1342 stop:1545 length:204 start_codon:yes stop_codon:yes gene_type:complete